MMQAIWRGINESVIIGNTIEVKILEVLESEARIAVISPGSDHPYREETICLAEESIAAALSR